MLSDGGGKKNEETVPLLHFVLPKCWSKRLPDEQHRLQKNVTYAKHIPFLTLFFQTVSFQSASTMSIRTVRGVKMRMRRNCRSVRKRSRRFGGSPRVPSRQLKHSKRVSTQLSKVEEYRLHPENVGIDVQTLLTRMDSLEQRVQDIQNKIHRRPSQRGSRPVNRTLSSQIKPSHPGKPTSYSTKTCD